MAINGKKITKAQMFSALANFLGQNDPEQTLATFTIGSDDKAEQVSLTIEDAVVGLAHELELLANKSKKSGGATKKATEAQTKMEQELLSYLADRPNEMFTVTQLVKNVPEFAYYTEPVTTQRVTPRLSAMEARGEVEKTKDKGKNLWKYVSGVADSDAEDWGKEDEEV